ncbi:MAG: hypothetical protein HYX68_07300 [Planctomycetes bacterium]|nr:hypothetical protein [Planctomycetota bacterium]
MDKLERLAYWKSIANDAVRAAGREGVGKFEEIVFRNEDDLFGFFDCFRPHGAGLEKVFADVVGGDEILQRVLRIYQSKETATAFGYFVIRRPIPATPERLVELTTQHLDKMLQIAISFDDAWLARELEKVVEIKIKRETISQKTRCDPDAREGYVYEVTGDWFRELEPMPSDALWMREAFYSIACDYNIARYLMWPLYRHATEIADPFAPYFELWTHGALPYFGEPGLVTVYVSGNC